MKKLIAILAFVCFTSTIFSQINVGGMMTYYSVNTELASPIGIGVCVSINNVYFEASSNFLYGENQKLTFHPENVIRVSSFAIGYTFIINNKLYLTPTIGELKYTVCADHITNMSSLHPDIGMMFGGNLNNDRVILNVGFTYHQPFKFGIIWYY